MAKVSTESMELDSDQLGTVPVVTDQHGVASTCPEVVEASAAPTLLKVETPDDDLLPSQYPWTMTAKVCLDRISPLTIDIWTNSVRNYWCVQPGVGTEKRSRTQYLKDGHHIKVKSEPMTVPDSNTVNQKDGTSAAETDTTTEDLIKHAESLLKHARHMEAQESQK